MVDKIVANKITCSGSKIEALRLTIWRNNKKLLYVTSDDLEVQRYDDEDDISYSRYMDYCKDRLIRIIQQGGIDGIDYDDTDIDEESMSNNGPSKYSISSFKLASEAKIRSILEDSRVKFKMHFNTEVALQEQYKDGNVKSANCTITVDIAGKTLQIIGEMKSGQLCTPKTMTIDGDEYKFNVTNLRKLDNGKLQ